MILLHLRNSICIRHHSRLLPTVTLLPPHSRLNPYSLTPQRHLSFAGLYASLSQSTPVLSLQSALAELHDWSGLPWWSVILLSTLGLRTLVVFPLAVHQHQVVSRLANVKEEMKGLAPELNMEVNVARVRYKWDQETAKRVFRKQFRELYNNAIVRDNCHPSKTAILALVQIPVWICFSVSLRNLAMASSSGISVPLQSIKSEGFLWFPDLTSPDPVIIPVLLLVTNLALIEMHALRSVEKGSRFQRVLLNTSRALILLIAVSATLNPSFVSFYWLISSSYGLMQNLLLMSPKFRRTVRIPATAKESLTPYEDIVTNFKRRVNKYFKL